MNKIDPVLQAQARANPTAPLRVIVRVRGDLAARAEDLTAQGFEVTRQLRLISGFAATAPGQAIADALEADWIVSIEPDAPVHTQ